ncbi:MAG: protein-tyrosine phosphatase family protein [Candidatus Brocadiia bacterium]
MRKPSCFRNLAWAVLAISVFLSACNCKSAAVAPAGPAVTLAQPDNSIPGLENFAKITDNIYRGAQPTAEGFAALKKMGVKTVINLRDRHSDAELLKGLGLKCIDIPSMASDIQETNIYTFIKAVTNPANQPVFIHCLHGSDRTGLMLAIYRVCCQDWPREEAVKEMDIFGRHIVYPNIPKYIRFFNVDETKTKALSAPEPAVQTID